VNNTPPEDPTKPLEVAILREFDETMREHAVEEDLRMEMYGYLQMAMKAARERKG
jgi:hypothetical protein